MRRLLVLLTILLLASPALATNKKNNNGGGSSVSNSSLTFRDAASSAAPLYMAECGQGVSGQGMGGGAAISIRAPICDVMLLLEFAGIQCSRDTALGIPNPKSCAVRGEMFKAALATTHAKLGKKGWRAKVQQYLPAVIAWMF